MASAMPTQLRVIARALMSAPVQAHQLERDGVRAEPDQVLTERRAIEAEPAMTQ